MLEKAKISYPDMTFEKCNVPSGLENEPTSKKLDSVNLSIFV